MKLRELTVCSVWSVGKFQRILKMGVRLHLMNPHFFTGRCLQKIPPGLKIDQGQTGRSGSLCKVAGDTVAQGSTSESKRLTGSTVLNG